MRRLPLALAALLTLFFANAASAGPRVHVTLGARVTDLDRFAAQELAGLLKRLFEAEVTVSDGAPDDPGHLILLGNPKNNPVLAKAAGDRWPKLSEQGHVVRSVRLRGGDVLLVGGGSPRATLWAVYELGHHFGVRSFLHGDVLPAQKPELRLGGVDIVREPIVRTRTWTTLGGSVTGPVAWGLKDHRRLLIQLAKLKFNRVRLAFEPWQPFVHYEIGRTKKTSAKLWPGGPYRVDGDTAGRRVFGGMEVFENPDFVGKTTSAERRKAATALARGIIAVAHDLGMEVDLAITPLEFPGEFRRFVLRRKPPPGPAPLAVGPGPWSNRSELQRSLVPDKVRAYRDAYPEADALHLTLKPVPQWADPLDPRRGLAGRVLSSPRFKEPPGKAETQALHGHVNALEFLQETFGHSFSRLQRPDRTEIPLTLGGIHPALFPVLDAVVPRRKRALLHIGPSARQAAARADLLATVPTKKVPSILALPLSDETSGLLPQLPTPHLHTLLASLGKHGWEGYDARARMPGDLNPAVHFLSRASFDSKVTPASAYEDLITPILGPGVAPRVLKGFSLVEEATDLLDEKEPGFAAPTPDVVMKHYKDAPVPEWWKEVRDRYAGAMNEMYRGIRRSRAGARPVLLYHAKRLEFAFHYMGAVEALRQAGQARAKGDKEEQLAHLEAATEAMYNALSAQADVARDQSDRGLIAFLNEHGYRPLQKELEAADR